MALNQTAYDVSLAYGKYEAYKSIFIGIIIGIILLFVSLYLFISNPKFNVTDTTPKKPIQNPDGTFQPPDPPVLTPASFFLKSGLFLGGILCLGGAYIYYNFINSKSNESVVATHGAVEGVSDLNRGIRNIFTNKS
jgi:ABC-type cobalt transport system substrate-binding protein